MSKDKIKKRIMLQSVNENYGIAKDIVFFLKLKIKTFRTHQTTYSAHSSDIPLTPTRKFLCIMNAKSNH